MTNEEWIVAVAPDLSKEVKKSIMAARGVDPLADYDGSKEVELAQADIYSRMLLIPEFSEGSLSIKYDLSSLKAEAQRIYRKYNDDRYEPNEPIIRRVKL